MHIIIGAIMAIAAMLIGVPAPARAQSPDPLTVERSITPADGVLGSGEFTVTLTLAGNAASCPPRVSDVQNDIILVIDRSASMYDERGDKVRALRAAANDFIDRVDLGRARVGIVQFDDTASVVQALTDNRDALRQAIDGIQSGSTTSIDQGVEFAMRELTSDRARPGAQPVIVLMTDGQQTDTAGAVGDAVPPITKARDAQARGMRVITIGLGQDADQALLQRMVAQPADFYFAPTPDQLAQVYANVAQNVVQAAAATDVVLEHTFDASAFEVVPGSISNNGALSGDKITWPVPSVAGAPVQLTYRAKARAMGNLSATRGDVVTFLQCAETPQTLSVPGGLPVQVAQPPQLPAATPGPVPTPQVLPVSDAPRTLPETLQVAAFNLFCDLSWLPWVLLLMWLLFLAWWLTRLWRRVQQKQPTCDLIPWLLLPLLITLAGFILNALSPAFCAREEVYFWRIPAGTFRTPNQPNGRVFMTDPIGAQPAREMAALSPGTCVGCHTVSSSAGLIASTTGGGTGQIKVYTLDGNPVNVPTVVGAFSAWSPDGSKLAVSTLDNNIVIIDIAARTATPLAGASDPNVLEAMPAWSADGSTIGFVRGGAADAPFRFGGSAEIVTVPASGGTAQPLQGASGSGFSYYPAYSPDGRWLAFTRHAGGTTTYAAPEAEIFLVPAAGGNPIRLRANDAADGTRLSNVSNSWATWSQDGRQLAFTSKRDDAAYDVYLTTIDGNGNSGPATPLRNAAEAGVFEHLPNWGRPPDVNVLPALLSLIPCLIPFLLVLLAWLLCKRRHRPHTISPIQTPMPMTPPSERKRPAPLPALAPEPLWQVAPTLIVGIGGSGRWVLTHLKKTLRDGNGGTLPKDVRFVLLDTSEREETNVFRDAQNRVANVSFAGVSLEPDEMLLLNTNLSAVIQRTREAADGDAALRGWFPYDDYRARLSLGAMTLAAGTAGRRPMARAGLLEKLRNANTPANVRSDQLGNDAAHLWQTLIDGSNQVKSADGQLVRVVVVGSLAGGMSGVLHDIAYLARLAARQVVLANGTVTVEGYLATPGAFDRAGVGQNATRLNVNAAAAARELERFQLSEGFPFPMTYGQSNDQAGLAAENQMHAQGNLQGLANGVCDWMLFDHVTLFGGEGSMDRGAGKSGQPWATVFASMADVIGLRMDGATNAGAAGDYHAGLRNDIAARQASEGKAVVSAAGSFVYRLPLRDIIDIAQAQWARRLAHAFVNREDETATHAAAEKAAQAFLSDAFAAQAAPMGIRAAGTLATGGALQTADVQAMAAVSVDGEGGDPFAGYLAHALETILNARASSEAMPAGVQGARAFLQLLQTRLTAALESARMQAAAAPASANGSFIKRVLGGAQVSQLDWEAAALRVQGWVNRAGRAVASLDHAQAVFDGDEREGRGVLGELEARQALAESRRKQMDQVAARRYVWTRAKRADADPNDATNQIEIVDDLLQQADAQLEESLNRFGWRAQPNGALALEILRGDNPITLKPNDAPAQWADTFVNETNALAAHVVTNAAKSLALHDALATQLPKASDPTGALVEQAWRMAQPHLAASRDVNGDLDGRRLAAAGVPLGLQQHAELGEVANAVRSIGTQGNRINLRYEPCATSFITATDRTAFTLVREYTMMPLFALPEMQAAWRVYARNAGSEVEPTTEGAALATVFAAERTALEFERRLESEDPRVVNEDFRALHPLVTLALARPEHAELYACAFAAGWITQQGGAARLTLPDDRAFTFDLRGRATATAGLDWRIAGLLRFAAGEADDAPAADALRNAFGDARTAPRQAWQAFLRSYRSTGGQRPFAHEPQAVRDLAAVAALAAYARLVPAENREERWNRMVMRRARSV